MSHELKEKWRLRFQSWKIWILAGFAVLGVLASWLFLRKQRLDPARPNPPTVTEKLEDARKRQEDEVVKSVERVAKARGREHTTRVEIEEIKKDPDEKARLRRLAELLKQRG